MSKEPLSSPKEISKRHEAYFDSIKTLLNSNFRATEVESHPKATLHFYVNEYLTKFHGDSPKKISQKTQMRVHTAVVKKLRSLYGPWVTIRLRNAKRWLWGTNLGHVFKTEQGRIYGTAAYDDLFITSHALDRWEERTNQENWNNFNRAHRRRYHVSPSALDQVIFAIETSIQVGISNEECYYRYLNVNGGILVIEILEGIMIIKTFLQYHMNTPCLQWYTLDAQAWLEDMGQLIDPPHEAEKELIKLSKVVPADFCYWYFGKI